MRGRFIVLSFIVCILVAFVNGYRRCRKCCRRDCCEARAHITEQFSSQNVPSTVPTTAFPSSALPCTASTNASQQHLPTPRRRGRVGAALASTCPPPGCPNGWTLYNKNCYKLLFGNTRLTRNECDQMCGQENSHLASIHSAEEHKWLFDFVTNTTGSAGSFGIVAPNDTWSYAVWIGLSVVDGNNPSTSPKYWTDLANRYLVSGDYGYVRSTFPWAHSPDSNPEWTKCVFMWIVDPRPNHPRGSWDDAACNTTESASSEYANGTVCKMPQNCNCPPDTPTETTKTSTMTTSKSTIPPPLQCDTCASVPVNCSTNVGSNRAGNIPYKAKTIMYPTSTEQVVTLVKGCNGNIRCRGHTHSFNEIINTNDTLISLEKMNKIIRYDYNKPSIIIQGGCLYADIIPDMESKGYALPMTAGLGDITVAGAVATGTHGGGINNTILSDHVWGWTIVLADGTVANWNRQDNPDLFPQVLVHLGALGIIVELELTLVPTYKLEKYRFVKLPMASFVQHFYEIFEAGYSTQLHWDCATPDYFTQVNIISRPGHPSYQDFNGVSNYFGATFDYKWSLAAWYVYTIHYKMRVPSYERIRIGSAFNVPYPAGPAAIQALIPLAAEINQYSNRFELRVVAPDEIWMSPSHKHNEFAIDIIWELDMNPVPTIAKVEAALEPYNCTSHWGKLFVMGPDKYKQYFEHWEDFIAMVKRYDPSGKFVNDFAKLKLEL